MIAWLMSAAAYAAIVYVDLCGTYDADYDDVSTVITQLDDDHFPDNGSRPARGALITLTITVPPYTEIPVRLADESATCAGGKKCACAYDVPLSDAVNYDLALVADVVIGSNAFAVLDNPTDNEVYYHQGTTNWTPVAGEKLLETGQHAAWRIAAAAGWALHRRPGIVCEDPWVFYTLFCPNHDTDVSCQHTPEEIYISSYHDDQKYVIAHELGHLMSVCANGGVNDANYGVNDTFDGDCTPGDGPMVDKRNAGEAAIEGIAWYYAAVAFNDTNEANCEFSKDADYNQDGDMAIPEDGEKSASCEEGGPGSSWADNDYIDAHCHETLADRGTLYDYMRAFWDAERGEGLTTAQVFQIYADADPENWDGDGGGITNSDDPKERLEDGASENGVLSAWNDVDAFNGIR